MSVVTFLGFGNISPGIYTTKYRVTDVLKEMHFYKIL